MSNYEILTLALSTFMLTAILIQLMLMYKTLKADHERRKKQSTLEYGGQLRLYLQPKNKQLISKYGNNIINTGDLDDKHLNVVREFLEVVEDLSVGVNTQIYDLDVINRMYGNFLINMFEKCYPYIKKRRIDEGWDSLYEEYEKLVLKLKSIHNNVNNSGNISSI